MRVLPEPIVFDWDKGNINKNYRKHKVTHKEAEEVYQSKPFLLSEDILHSLVEKQYQALGKTHGGRLLFLSFTLRMNKVRIISARDMSRKEQLVYEKAKENTSI